MLLINIYKRLKRLVLLYMEYLKIRIQKIILLFVNIVVKVAVTNINTKWCKPCQIDKLKNNFTNWTSGNEKIDNLIQEIQLNIDSPDDIIFEWVSYNKLLDIKIGKSEKLYSAIWNDGPLYYTHDNEYIRFWNKAVILKYLNNLQKITNKILKKIKDSGFLIIWNITRSKHKRLYYYFGNEKINGLIQEKQLNVDSPNDIIFEWILYNKLDDIKILEKSEKLYSAIWKDGPLYYAHNKKEYFRFQNKAVILKYLDDNIQNISNQILKKVKDSGFIIYGISQNPITKDYVIICEYCCKICGKVFTSSTSIKWCKMCQINKLKNNFINWNSGNEKINGLIQEKQLNVDSPNDVIFEWILYNKLDDIKMLEKSENLYSAIWKDGPLYYAYNNEYLRFQNKEVILKYSNKLQDITNEFLKETKASGFIIYGISQNLDTKDYIIICEYCCKSCGKVFTNTSAKWCKPCQINRLKNSFKSWTSGNEKIDKLIQIQQLNIDNSDDIIFEWIPYNQFSNIEEIGSGKFTKVYFAIWKNGFLKYNINKNKYSRKKDEKVTLKCLCNVQNIINEIINKDKSYINNFVFGISQNPDTKDYIIVLSNEYFNKCCIKCGEEFVNIRIKWCKACLINDLKNNFINWTSGDEKINDLIQKMQLNINNPNDIIFEWISYDQFDDINVVEKSDKICSAIWKDGPLYYKYNNQEYFRSQNKTVILKHLNNSQNITNEFLKEFKTSSFLIYGISQNSDTKDYIIICKYCCKRCGDTSTKWCKLCAINKLKYVFTNLTSRNGNEETDDLIQETQENIDNPDNVVFEWIPYNQFSNIEEISSGIFAKVYSAVWHNRLLSRSKNKYLRKKDEKVALKCLYGSQNNTNEFINEVEAYINDIDNSVLGISQNTDTKGNIIVFSSEYFSKYCNKCDEEFTNVSVKWCKSCLLNNLKNDFVNWSSKNKLIDNLIQEMQLKVDSYEDTLLTT
ncbi:unnamed protein product [Rhizophagus irregularis]|nr:unnamed protein product [Rhizophagus irregularis]